MKFERTKATKCTWLGLLMCALALFATQSHAAKWETVGGKTQLVVNLRFVCSSWLYLRFLSEVSSSVGSVPGVNRAKCETFATAARADAQQLFRRSELPIRFTYTYEIEPEGYSYLLGADQRNEATRIAQANQGRMPGLKVTDAYIYWDQWYCQGCTGTWRDGVDAHKLTGAQYDLTDPYMTQLLDWAERNPQYLPKADDFSVTILVKPFRATGQQAMGIVKDMIDWQSRISNNSLTPVGDLTPENYFRRVGVIATSYDYARGTVSHELGHVLGALHERSNWLDYPRTAGFLNAAGTQVRPGGAYTHHDITNAGKKDNRTPHDLTCINTIMLSSPSLPCTPTAKTIAMYPNVKVVNSVIVNNFSSSWVIVPEYGRDIGSVLADNRQVVGETMKFLYGGKCFAGATLPPLVCP